jgi:hypothetical protein
VICAQDVAAFATLWVLAFERSGALMAKNAADTVRKVWICRLFILCTPFFRLATYRAIRDSAPKKVGATQFAQVRELDRIFKTGSLIVQHLHVVTSDLIQIHPLLQAPYEAFARHRDLVRKNAAKRQISPLL